MLSYCEETGDMRSSSRPSSSPMDVSLVVALGSVNPLIMLCVFEDILATLIF